MNIYKFGSFLVVLLVMVFSACSNDGLPGISPDNGINLGDPSGGNSGPVITSGKNEFNVCIDPYNTGGCQQSAATASNIVGSRAVAAPGVPPGNFYFCGSYQDAATAVFTPDNIQNMCTDVTASVSGGLYTGVITVPVGGGFFLFYLSVNPDVVEPLTGNAVYEIRADGISIEGVPLTAYCLRGTNNTYPVVEGLATRDETGLTVLYTNPRGCTDRLLTNSVLVTGDASIAADGVTNLDEPEFTANGTICNLLGSEVFIELDTSLLRNPLTGAVVRATMVNCDVGLNGWLATFRSLDTQAFHAATVRDDPITPPPCAPPVVCQRVTMGTYVIADDGVNPPVTSELLYVEDIDLTAGIYPAFRADGFTAAPGNAVINSGPDNRHLPVANN